MGSVEDTKRQIAEGQAQIAKAQEDIKKAEAETALAEQQVKARQEEIGAASKTVYSERFRRERGGIAGLRERQQAYQQVSAAAAEAGIAQSEIDKYKTEIQVSKENVAAYQGQIGAAQKAVSDYEAEQRAYERALRLYEKGTAIDLWKGTKEYKYLKKFLKDENIQRQAFEEKLKRDYPGAEFKIEENNGQLTANLIKSPAAELTGALGGVFVNPQGQAVSSAFDLTKKGYTLGLTPTESKLGYVLRQPEELKMSTMKGYTTEFEKKLNINQPIGQLNLPEYVKQYNAEVKRIEAVQQKQDYTKTAVEEALGKQGVIKRLGLNIIKATDKPIGVGKLNVENVGNKVVRVTSDIGGYSKTEENPLIRGAVNLVPKTAGQGAIFIATTAIGGAVLTKVAPKAVTVVASPIIKLTKPQAQAVVSTAILGAGIYQTGTAKTSEGQVAGLLLTAGGAYGVAKYLGAKEVILNKPSKVIESKVFTVGKGKEQYSVIDVTIPQRTATIKQSKFESLLGIRSSEDVVVAPAQTRRLYAYGYRPNEKGILFTSLKKSTLGRYDIVTGYASDIPKDVKSLPKFSKKVKNIPDNYKLNLARNIEVGKKIPAEAINYKIISSRLPNKFVAAISKSRSTEINIYKQGENYYFAKPKGISQVENIDVTATASNAKAYRGQKTIKIKELFYRAAEDVTPTTKQPTIIEIKPTQEEAYAKKVAEFAKNIGKINVKPTVGEIPKPISNFITTQKVQEAAPVKSEITEGMAQLGASILKAAKPQRVNLPKVTATQLPAAGAVFISQNIPKQAPAQATAVKEITQTISKPAIDLEKVKATATISSTTTKPAEATIQSEGTKSISQFRFGLASKTKELLKDLYKKKLSKSYAKVTPSPQVTEIAPRPTTRNIPYTYWDFNLPRNRAKKTTEEFTPADYDVFTFKGGKEVKAFKNLQLGEAVRKGKQLVKTTLRASFTVKKKGKAVELSRFAGGAFKTSKRSSKRLVQIANLRLSNIGETKEILMSREKFNW